MIYTKLVDTVATKKIVKKFFNFFAKKIMNMAITIMQTWL